MCVKITSLCCRRLLAQLDSIGLHRDNSVGLGRLLPIIPQLESTRLSCMKGPLIAAPVKIGAAQQTIAIPQPADLVLIRASNWDQSYPACMYVTSRAVIGRLRYCTSVYFGAANQ